MKIEEYEIRKIKDFLTLEDLKDKLASNNLILIKAYTDKLLEEKLPPYLTKEEIKKSKDYKSEIAKINYLVSKAILNLALKGLLEKEIDDLTVKRDKNNKPYVESTLGLKFNISHTEGLVLLAFFKREVGVDIEKINYKFEFKDILENCFTRDEIINIDNNIISFYRYWTAKEAYLKCDGIGLIRNLREIEIISYGNKVIEISDNKNNIISRLQPLNYDGKYVGAICLEEK
ncbi:TPA: 4'-phosphopantetheinyl transferase superfamily protein [Clostridioides difficile]|uniref:4'-phosphopantetheinyl transferase family protein n=1 Tax=Enterococcus faecalis TaxID=1351 RepID=UPI002B3CCEAD|nr:4'-phosphopantetheinyl transferase superfamily protein [Clostridioides difficile]HCQ5647516.1 4'-phosphopantetheinyl transferase superfamily protein [Clostridioides difficile]HCQ5766131.1 4'-phosphopantetheinyl transferase superfamily protein [Clostridioides difficile]HEQ6242229.1 4'-phosphopantetheinyl transferase superfamily protein [Streptococcus pyogenes]